MTDVVIPKRKGRPRGDANRLKRLRAFELYAGGVKRSAIATDLGVTKAAVTGWAKKDRWDERLAQIAAQAQTAVDFTVGETIADVALKIRSKYEQRLRELDHLCTSSLTPPQARISAIKAWFEIGQKVQPDAFKPLTDPRNLELIQDLLPGAADIGSPVPPTSADPQPTSAPPAVSTHRSLADAVSSALAGSQSP